MEPDLQSVVRNHKTIDNQHRTHDAESVLARRWAHLVQDDGRLATVIESWPDLPGHIQSAILTLCQLPGDAGGEP